MIATKTQTCLVGRQGHEDAQRIFDGKLITVSRWVYPSGLNNNTATKSLPIAIWRHEDAQKNFVVLSAFVPLWQK